MFDTRVRRLLAPALDGVGARIADVGVPPLALTTIGWLAGIAACVAITSHSWVLALVLWLANRVLDGLDGPVARQRGATDLGGFLDIVADFSVYAGFVVAVAIAEPEARLACLALLTAYYISGTAFLALSALIERRGGRGGDGRSLRFVGGLAEGTETVVVYILICVLPRQAELIAWLFTVAVAITAVQRVVLGVHILCQVPPHPATGPRAVPARQESQ
ncbi:CDP-alcohol phosphatidyltransferase family protein [Kribbella qitaiheensis]|uniref:CDP-alcohol phosphatidyltransferase family protein n=1 Tax=Kribbella qitaiheensis TaxID=1544730 RepID=A0A7G6WW82_9ACTN|nr:CDP-alcohol phosphatidyltransferase family protein [Kribbella qitaiheensis]QNE18247.1 CDP-alcohol phosphatidyltransferase family protein [Kribbella qitaiheensis]